MGCQAAAVALVLFSGHSGDKAALPCGNSLLWVAVFLHSYVLHSLQKRSTLSGNTFGTRHRYKIVCVLTGKFFDLVPCSLLHGLVRLCSSAMVGARQGGISPLGCHPQ